MTGLSRRQISSSSRARAVVAESRAHASSMGDARRAMELSRERMYAERSKRNRTIMLYTTGSVSLLSLGHQGIQDRGHDQCSRNDAEVLR